MRGRKRRAKGDVIKLAASAFLAPAEWVALWRAQGGACAICRSALRNRYDKSSTGLVGQVDHDHKKEKRDGTRASIRGLLCAWCNHQLLGVAARDNAEKLRRAVEYLEDPPAPRVLNLAPSPAVGFVPPGVDQNEDAA